MKKILVIGDDLEVCKQIKYNLQNETTEVYYAEAVKDAGTGFFIRWLYPPHEKGFCQRCGRFSGKPLYSAYQQQMRCFLK